jgi:hypothetical protein
VAFGGLPGFAVDAILGGDKNQLVVAVGLRPDPSCERIGSQASK